MRDKVININVTEGAVDDFEPWENSERKKIKGAHENIPRHCRRG